MTTPTASVLIDSFDRVRESVHDVVGGLSREALTHRVDRDANSIGWEIWHLSRVADDHVATVGGFEQVWLVEGWFERFALPFDPHDHGYGQTSEQVGQVDVDGHLLVGYYDAVHARVVEFLETITDDDLPRIVDRRWDPPVTLAVRLVSVVNDCTQHVGQAAFVRGLIDRRGN